MPAIHFQAASVKVNWTSSRTLQVVLGAAGTALATAFVSTEKKVKIFKFQIHAQCPANERDSQNKLQNLSTPMKRYFHVQLYLQLCVHLRHSLHTFSMPTESKFLRFFENELFSK